MSDALDQIAALDALLRAWVVVDRDRALRTARTLDAEAAMGRFKGPLHGVPVGIKDIFHVAGLPTAAGAHSFAHVLPNHGAFVVAKLAEAGAVILGKTATAEFAYADPAATVNPWHLEHTPGGSSSGSAAAIAAQMVPLALGTQTLGSVLRPAAYCGIVGFKPTHGRVSCRGVIPSAWSLDHVGVFVRTVVDAALALEVIGGYDPDDPYSQPAPPDDYMAALSAIDRPLRLALAVHQDFPPISSDVAGTLRMASGEFRKKGAELETVELPSSFTGLHAAGTIVLRAEAAAYHRPQFEQYKDFYGPKIAALVESGLSVSALEYLDARRHLQAFRRDITPLLTRFDALLLPATPAPAPLGLTSTGDPYFCAPWSLAGVPAITVPSGLTADRLPLGVQLVSEPFGESTLLAVARWCEDALDFHESPPLLRSNSN